MSQKGRDSETEYRAHLRHLQARDPARFAEQMGDMQQQALEGYQTRGRGLLVSIDNAQDGCLTYVPAEQADLQFGADAARLCKSYDPATQWILLAFTDGRSMPVVIDWQSEQDGPEAGNMR